MGVIADLALPELIHVIPLTPILVQEHIACADCNLADIEGALDQQA